MVDVAIAHSYKNPGAELARAVRLARLASTVVQVARFTDPADPLGTDYWNTLGVVAGDPTMPLNIEKFEDKSGSPETRKSVIKTAQNDGGAFQISHIGLTAFKLAYLNELSPTITDALDGQTICSSSTNLYTTVLASASNIAVGDALHVVHSSFLDEVVFVETISGNTITHNRLSQAPIASTPFKKIAGPTLANAGMKFISGGVSFPRMKVRILRYEHPNQYMFVQYRPEGYFTGSDGFKYAVKEPMSVNYSIDFIDQGSESLGVYYGEDYYVPLES